jgi:hypothetical protein
MSGVLTLLSDSIKQDEKLIESPCGQIGGACDSSSNDKGKLVSVFVPEGFTLIYTLAPIVEVNDATTMDKAVAITTTLTSRGIFDKTDALRPARGIVYGIIIGALLWIIFIWLLINFQ